MRKGGPSGLRRANNNLELNNISIIEINIVLC